jgi:toxin ParE1/3/4
VSRARTGKRPPSPKGGGAPRAYRLRWSRRAEADLEAIGDYIAADDPVAAERWIGKLLERARKASLLPFAGRVVPELQIKELREVILRTYRIVYRIPGDEVQVITGFEGHRLFPADVDIEGDVPADRR